MWKVERMRRTEMEVWYRDRIVQLQWKGMKKNRIKRQNGAEGRGTDGDGQRMFKTKFYITWPKLVETTCLGSFCSLSL